MEGACEIERLPEELLSAVLARTSPRDTCRAAAVSPAFRAAADDDIIWDRFLPTGGLPPLADEEPPAPASPSSKKELVLRLSAGPALLQDRLVSVWLDRENGAKCYMLSARNLFGDKPQYWTWIPLKDSRFSEGAELADVNWLEIHGKIHSKMLSQDTTYAAYMVFKMAADLSGLYFPAQEASVGAGATNLTRKVCLQAEDKNEFYDEGDNEDEYDKEDMDEYYRSLTVRRPVHEENVTFPQERADGWLEVELGEFFCEGGDDGDVSIGLTDTESGEWKSSVIVQGIEIRRKKSG